MGALESVAWKLIRGIATMLTKITLNGIKCFDYLELPCSKLNLLCGLNGSGKSTVLQALLLIHQSHYAGDLDQRGAIGLSGELLQLGLPQDVLRWPRSSEFASVSLESDKTNNPWDITLLEEDLDEADLRVEPGTVYQPLNEVFWEPEWRNEPPFGKRTWYIPADRLGPSMTYPWLATSRPGVFGPRAAYAWNSAGEPHGFLNPDDGRKGGHEQAGSGGALNYWLQQVSPGVEVKVSEHSDAEIVVVRYEYRGSDGKTSGPYRPVHVGFGLSYTVPVIRALLSYPGALCLIENPEAHLHPRGQTKLGELAARAAKEGVQMLVETHSDHFMDGVRIAVREGIIAPDDVKFHYFQRDGNLATVTSPEIDEDGRLSEWPEGFFDQSALNMAKLLAPSVRNA